MDGALHIARGDRFHARVAAAQRPQKLIRKWPDFHVLRTSAPPDKETDPKIAADFHVLTTSPPPAKKTEV